MSRAFVCARSVTEGQEGCRRFHMLRTETGTQCHLVFGIPLLDSSQTSCTIRSFAQRGQKSLVIASFSMGIAQDKNDIPYPYIKERKWRGCTVPDRCRLRAMGSEAGEVRQSWVSTRGKTHLPVVRMKLQESCFPDSREVPGRRGHTSHSGVLLGQKSWALQKGKPALYPFSHHEIMT